MSMNMLVTGNHNSCSFIFLGQRLLSMDIKSVHSTDYLPHSRNPTVFKFQPSVNLKEMLTVSFIIPSILGKSSHNCATTMVDKWYDLWFKITNLTPPNILLVTVAKNMCIVWTYSIFIRHLPSLLVATLSWCRRQTFHYGQGYWCLQQFSVHGSLEHLRFLRCPWKPYQKSVFVTILECGRTHVQTGHRALRI